MCALFGDWNQFLVEALFENRRAVISCESKHGKGLFHKLALWFKFFFKIPSCVSHSGVGSPGMT